MYVMASFQRQPCTLQAFAFCIIVLCSFYADAGTVGICYGRVADNLAAPADVVGLLKANNISKVRLFDSDPAVLQAFAGSEIGLMTAVPNELLESIGSNPEAAAGWVQGNVVPFYPATRIEYIAVGNEVLHSNPEYAPFLVPAMQNIYGALESAGLRDAIKVSSTHAASVLGNSYPPSQGAFDSEVVDIMKPLLDFLAQTGAPLMANVYPFFSYLDNPVDIQLQYALFTSPAAYFTDTDGLAYSALFDATVDAVFSAMEALGHADIAVVVTETGWPWSGPNKDAENPDNAITYNSNLVARVLSNVGTPKRPGMSMEAYLFALFNEDLKPGQEFERDFGLFYPTGQKVYNINFTSS